MIVANGHSAVTRDSWTQINHFCFGGSTNMNVVLWQHRLQSTVNCSKRFFLFFGLMLVSLLHETVFVMCLFPVIHSLLFGGHPAYVHCYRLIGLLAICNNYPVQQCNGHRTLDSINKSLHLLPFPHSMPDTCGRQAPMWMRSDAVGGGCVRRWLRELWLH